MLDGVMMTTMIGQLLDAKRVGTRRRKETDAPRRAMGMGGLEVACAIGWAAALLVILHKKHFAYITIHSLQVRLLACSVDSSQQRCSTLCYLCSGGWCWSPACAC